MSAPARSGPRFLSLGTKVVTITSLVLLLISAALFVQLSARERTKLIAAKTTATFMVTELLATELRAALDFGDTADIAAQLDHLHTNPDIVGAAVWSTAALDTPTAQWSTDGGPANAAPAADAADGAVVSADWLVATQTVTNRAGIPVARLTIIFSLARENEAFAASRLRLFWMSGGLALFTAALLGVLARRYVISPLRRLSEAASALALGRGSSSVEVLANDEIGDLTRAFNVMGAAVVARQEQLQGEMALAQHIQTAILPRSLRVPGLELSAAMVPAAEVGGDYYDVLPVEDGSWIGVGDVAGHGLDAGLIMLMMQSIIAGLVQRDPKASPGELLCVLNAVLFDNVRNRLMRDDHATLTLFRYDRSGRVVFAGAHEDILVYRAESGTCELIGTPGTWVGARRDIRRGTVDNDLQLRPGDVMLLYTDGVTEMRNEAGEGFGIDRLTTMLDMLHGEPVGRIKDDLLDALRTWSSTPDDDITLLVARYTG
jgi:serine phosphatase RsbU (regulator of sigma subunit)